MSKYTFTSESVTEGHPDKICDEISDAILDAYLEKDENARVAVETTVKNNTVILLGEISSKASVNVEEIARKTIKEIGYDNDNLGFNGDSAEIILRLDKQSPEIAQGVDKALEVRGKSDEFEIGAGDQGMVFGFAINETKELMPLPISLAHKLSRKLTEVRKNNKLSYLRPDGKTQVSVRYEDGKPKAVDAIVVSTQHDPNKKLEDITKDIINYVIKPTIPIGLINNETKIYVNPTGSFVIGGPVGDSGLTGRKIIVDTYGGYSRHGGGAFSGKDPTKVDRSAAYAARHAAKNIVAAGLADKVEIQISYAIGVAKPVSILVDTFNTGKVSDEKLEKAARDIFDFRPNSIIKRLGLNKPIYKNVAAYGHIGREDLNVPWEKYDYVQKLKNYFNLQ